MTCCDLPVPKELSNLSNLKHDLLRIQIMLWKFLIENLQG